MGGTCTNDGCVTTHVLAHAARLVGVAHQFADYGLMGEAPKVDFTRVLDRTCSTVEEVHEKKRLAERLEAGGVRVFEGAVAARFADERSLVLGDGRRIEAERFVLRAGGHARRLNLPGGELPLTTATCGRWWSGPAPSPSSAATGCQLASIFAAFGARVPLLEVAPRILPGEDEAVSEGRRRPSGGAGSRSSPG